MTEIFNVLIKNKLTPNQLYYLHTIKHKTVPAKFINIALENERLSNEGWIDNSKLTPKCIALLDSLDSFFRKSKKETNADIMGDRFFTEITEYRELFPNIKLPSGKPARTNIKTIESLFRWFFTTYDYDWPVILGATKMYLDEYESRNWAYMRTSQYFIRKQNQDRTFDSDLANYCDMFINGLDTEDQHFKEKVV
jgi:hypothetical protein